MNTKRCDDKPWTDEGTLRRLYLEEGKTQREIGDVLGCSQKTIINWMEKFGIPSRSSSESYRLKRSGESWRDEETLRELYVEKGLSQSEIGEMLGCAPETVFYHMEKNGIDARTPEETFARRRANTPAQFSTRQEDGYEYWHSEDDWVYAHRLLAVAEYGFNAVRGKHVHHKNNIPWDNRTDNIELLSQSRHMEHHNSKLSWIDQIAIVEKYRNTDLSHRDLGEIYDVDNSNITRAIQRVKQAGKEVKL